MRWLRGVASAAALSGLSPRQDPPADSTVVVDAETGFTFSQYVSANGISYRIARPDPAPESGNFDVVLQVAAPIAIGWAGMAWGGTMTYNPLTVGWANGTIPVHSSRWAFGYYVPPPYTGAVYNTLTKGTHVNATHWQYTTTCTGCTYYGDDDIGYTQLNATGQNQLAFAYSNSAVTTPADNSSNFNIHDGVGHWYHDFGPAGNKNFAALVSKNSEGSGTTTTATGTSTGTPTITTPRPTTTTTTTSKPITTTSSSTTSTTKTTTSKPVTSTTSSSTTSTGKTTTSKPVTTTTSSSSTSTIKTTRPPAPTSTTPALPFPSSCKGVSAFRYSYTVAAGWKVTKLAGSLTAPRTVVFDPQGNMLVLQAGLGVSVHTFGPDGCLNSSKTVLSNSNLNHGLTLTPDGKSLFASSITTAWRWDWDGVNRKISTNSTVVIKGMSPSGHQTRYLAIVPSQPNLLIAQVGSNDNWDYQSGSPSVGRAAIKVFDLSKLPSGGYTYATSGYQFGYGLRNEVGMAFDPSGMVWGVENSGDDFVRTANGKATDIHTDNPAEELNYLGDPTKPNNNWYGYPTCFSIWDPSVISDTKMITGQQFVVTPNSTYNDATCAQKSVAPRLTFQAHSAPIGAVFNAAATSLYVTFHGSWDRNPPTGFKVIEVPFAATSGDQATGSYGPVAKSDSRTGYQDILSNRDVTQCGYSACFRPTAAVFDPSGRLIIGSDATAEGELYILSKA